MDPITTAIVAALTAGVVSGSTQVGQKVISDAYEALKALIKKKYGEKSEVVKAVENLEARPDSTGRKATLQEEVGAAKVDQDTEVIKASQALLERLKDYPGGENHIQTAIGSYIAQADRASSANVSVNQPKEGSNEQ
jgi:hypothetical protein